ncbi:hypothetical protein RI129_006228 [Pyrocoelia pectoralis]|uniref:Uncharacterized protein n=1 Tax=Pyrocoelia pectoralis TaxID=417401 RepID=A0AAN7VGL6_9COLE
MSEVDKSVKWLPILTATAPTYRQSAKTFHADCSPSCTGIQQLKKLQEQRDEEREKHSLEVTNLRQTVLELEKVFVRPQVTDEDPANDTSKENFLIDKEDLQNLEKEIQEEYSKLLLENEKRISDSDSQNKQLKREISQLLDRIREHEKNELLNDERTEDCEKEIDHCKRNLMELKNKLLVIKELLQQKLDQYAQLEIEFREQNESLSDARKTLTENQAQHEGEVSRLQGIVAGLKDELITAEETCQKLREDYKVTQAQVEGYTKLYEDIKEKLQSTENNVMDLNAYICQLQEDGSCLRKDLESKNDEVNEVKAQLSRLKTDEKGVIILKTELDNVFKQHSLLRAKNEALYLELCEIKQAAATYSHRSKINECHIKKFLHEVQVLQTVRAKLTVENQEYVEEINYFRSAYAELYKKYEIVVRQIEELRHYSRLRGGHSASTDKNAYIKRNVNSASCSEEDNYNYSIDVKINAFAFLNQLLYLFPFRMSQSFGSKRSIASP